MPSLSEEEEEAKEKENTAAKKEVYFSERELKEKL